MNKGQFSRINLVANDIHHYDNSRDNRFGSDVPYSDKYANHVGFCMGVMLCRSYIAWVWWFEMDL